MGYNVEKRKNGSNLWGLVNSPDEPIRGTVELGTSIDGLKFCKEFPPMGVVYLLKDITNCLNCSLYILTCQQRESME